MHLEAVYAFFLQRLTECILPEQRQQHVLGHHELVIEEPGLLHGIVHQNTHISGQSHIIHSILSFLFLSIYWGYFPEINAYSGI